MNFSSLSLYHISKDTLASARDMAESGVKGSVAHTPQNDRALRCHITKDMNADRGEYLMYSVNCKSPLMIKSSKVQSVFKRKLWRQTT